MPNVRKDHAKYQFNEFTYWEHIFSLIPEKDQKLRKEIDSMIDKSTSFAIFDQPLLMRSSSKRSAVSFTCLRGQLPSVFPPETLTECTAVPV